jgi:YVTN family beta-propeller protein
MFRTSALTAAALVAALAAPAFASAAKPSGWVARLKAAEAIRAPAGERPALIDRDGTSILPSGRLINPAGPTVEVAPHPFGLVLSPDERVAATVNSGIQPFSVSLVQTTGDHPAVRQIPPGNDNDEGIINAVFMGAAFSADGSQLFVSGGNDGNIVVLDPRTGTRVRTIELNVPFGGRQWRDGYTGDLRLTQDGRTLYALDQANFRLVRVDVASGMVTGVYPTGRYPFGLELSPDGRRAYVANVGMFAYSFVDGFDPAHPETTALPFPAFGFGTPEARMGTIAYGLHVPGLGDPNDERSFSLWTYDLQTGERIGATKTGPLVGEKVAGIPAVGGSSPNSVATDGRFVYVANNASDTIAVLDADGRDVIAQIPLGPGGALRGLRGTMPFGLALHGDRLYVAESGINAVGVIDTRARRVIGHIPVGWYPAKVAVSRDGKQLFVANAKGFGSGPNTGAGYDPARGDSYIGSLMHGSVTRVDLPAGDGRLKQWTRDVLAYNGFSHRRKADDEAAIGSPIRHVIFVTRENRTFDQVLGDLGSVGGRTVRGDASVANAPATGYGSNTTVVYADGTTASGVNVTPNAHALARQFAFGDNAYVDSDVSADGHRWLVGVAPDEFVETAVPATYGGRQDFRIDQTPEAAVGRRGFFESNSASDPNDYPEAGSIWDGFARAGTRFRNYGEGFEHAGIYERAGYEPTGARLPLNIPMPEPLFENTDRNFPTYNLNISEQWRYEEFAREFRAKYLNGGEDLPQFVNVYFPVDHTAGPRPDRGYPSRASYVADDDYALGRLVELVSHSKYWSSTAIVVTEDDAQDGLDTVDAHRTVQLVISPWAKRGYVSHDHTSIASIIKTVNLLTGTPLLNQFDAAASSLADSFSNTPDFTPYTAVPPDPRVYQPDSAAAARARPGVPGPPSPEMDEPAQMHAGLLARINASKAIRAGRRPAPDHDPVEEEHGS